jgi:hypothetical protein
MDFLADATERIDTKRKRKENFSDEETKKLAILFKEHESILNAAHSSTVTNAIKESVWKEIATQVSAVEGRHRTVAEIKIKKKNLKSSAKNKEVSNRKQRLKTGGGTASIQDLSVGEDIILGTVSELEMSGVAGGIDIHLIEGEFINFNAKSRVIT